MTEHLPLDDAALALEVETGTGVLRLDLARRLVAEALGTALLIIAVVGSGIMASRLSPDDVGLQLLENSTATFRSPFSSGASGSWPTKVSSLAQ